MIARIFSTHACAKGQESGGGSSGSGARQGRGPAQAQGGGGGGGRDGGSAGACGWRGRGGLGVGAIQSVVALAHRVTLDRAAGLWCWGGAALALLLLTPSLAWQREAVKRAKAGQVFVVFFGSGDL
jgi:hypothetical protein